MVKQYDESENHICDMCGSEIKDSTNYRRSEIESVRTKIGQVIARTHVTCPSLKK